MRPGIREREEGQAAVFITLLLMFALIALTALAIDGGHLYVVRRDLQNMADAACLAAAEELALGGDDAAAWTLGREYVIRNGGEFFSDWTDPSDNEGTGSGLSWGIEIAGESVRVALHNEVPTYFTMIFNRTGAEVGAFSHCNRGAGWGPLLPIAVRRYEYNNPQEDQLDLVANKKADPRDALGYATCEQGVDCHYPATSNELILPSRYGTIRFYELKGTYVSQPKADASQDADTGNIDCDLPPEDGTYEGVCVLGVHAATNDGTENYTGWVSLDIRNIVGMSSPDYSTSPTYLNNTDGQAATNKALSSEWFCQRGWRGQPMPMLGDQLAFLPGVSADFAPKAMLACNPPWEVGDQFIGVVYTGYVWDIPDLEVEIEPEYHEISATIPGASHTVTYTVTLKKPPESPEWPEVANFQLQAPPSGWFTQPPPVGVTPVVDFVPDDTLSLLPSETEKQVFMTVSVADPVTPTNYVSGLTVEVVETGIGLERWASTSFAYRADSTFDSMEDFTLYAEALVYKSIQGAKISVLLPTMAFGGFKDNNAPVDAIMTWPADKMCQDVFTLASCQGKIRIPSVNEAFDLRVRADAPVGQYGVRLVVHPTGVPSHSVDIVVYVQAPSGGDPTRFVIVEGFADFELTYIDGNDVVAYAIGPVVSEITSTLLYGMRPSLLPW
jgi:hypothetical protein